MKQSYYGHYVLIISNICQLGVYDLSTNGAAVPHSYTALCFNPQCYYCLLCIALEKGFCPRSDLKELKT